jgi:hypothetical protein
VKKRWITYAAAGWLILGCSLFQPNITAQTRTPALRPAKTLTAGLERGVDGLWRVFYSWGCGSFSEAGWILHADGTFYSPEANGGGTWTLERSVFRLTFDYSPHTTYSGTVNAARDSMEGTMESEDGKTGCWHASRDVPTPTVSPTGTPTPP